MNFAFTSEQELLRQTVREFAEQEIAPHVETMEKTDEVPLALLQKMGAQGYLGVTVPQADGGSGMGHVARMIILEEIGRISAAMAMALQCLHFGAGMIADAGTPEQKQKYLGRLLRGESFAAAAITEPAGGSDPASIATTAVDNGDHYLVNGRKCFITNSHISDVAVVVAKTQEEPKKEFSAFIIDSSMTGYKYGRAEHKIGFKGCVTGELVFDQVKVPKENLLGAPGQGLALALKGINIYGRTGIVGVALGIMQRALEEATAFAQRRVLYGKPIANLQAIQFRLAEIYAELEACRLLAYKAAWLLDQNRRADAEIAAAKFYVTEAALRVTRKSMDIHGGYGCMKEYTVERLLRDAQLLIPADGTNDIQRIVVARTITSPKGR